MAEKLSNQAQVKTYLQIADSSKDTVIDTFLPVAESAVKQITNNCWDITCKATWSNGGTVLTIDQVTVYTGRRSVYGPYSYWSAAGLDLEDYFFTGNIVGGTGIPDRSAIVSVSDSAKTITIDQTATAAGNETEIVINIFPVMGKVILSQIVSYYYDTNSADYAMDNDSESAGTLSFTKGDSETLGKGGVPNKFSVGLRPLTRPRFK